MSLARAVSASQASDYYYEKDPILAPEGKAESSFWYGKLADSEHFNLEGKVADKSFTAVINGLDPNNTKNQLIQDGVNKEHRAGVDLAFSAPKSVSVIALHVGDDRLIEAHADAVKEALSYFEEHFSYARRTENNVTKPVHTGNILAACFNHSLSRSIDPQLHTHAVVINMTETDKGFRAIDNYNLFNQQNLMLNIYQSALAIKTKALGYNIEVGRNGNWEIAGVDKDILEAFSKRSKEIDEEAKRLKEKHPEWSEAKLRDVATLKSRDSKDSKITEPELREEWDKTADKQQILNSVKEASEIRQDMPYKDPKTVLLEAAKAIHENESTFTKSTLLNTAMSLSRGQLGIQSLTEAMGSVRIYDGESKEKAFKMMAAGAKGFSIDEKTGEIIRRTGMFETGELEMVGEEKRSGYVHPRISTKEQIEMEKSVLNMAKEGKNAMVSIMLPDKISEKLKDSRLTAGQEAMVANMLSSADRFTIVQGDAGTGKTFAVNTFNKIVSSVNPEIQVHMMGFTGRASYELEQATGVNASTIDSFLLALQKTSEENKPERSVWIVDEASMVSSKHFHEIMTNAKKYNASVHFVGDGKQLQAVGAGRLFKDLQALNIVKTIEMSDVLRQRTGYMKYLVENIKNYQENRSSEGIVNAFDVMEDKKRIIEIQGAGDRINKAVDLYLSYYTEGRSVLMLTPINKERYALNDAIRTKLKDSGDIEEGKVFATKQIVSLSGANRRIAGNYEEGMHIFLSSKFGGIKAGSEGVIKEIDKKSNTVRVTFGSRDLQINLGKHGEKISAFRVEEREFSEGDKIVFGKNDKMLNVQNGSVGIIEKMDGSNLTVKMEDGSRRKFDSEKSYSFIDYGYVLTVHKSQGQTADVSILYANTGTKAKDTRIAKEKEKNEAKKEKQKIEKKVQELKDKYQKFESTKEEKNTKQIAIERNELLKETRKYQKLLKEYEEIANKDYSFVGFVSNQGATATTTEMLYVSSTRAKDDFYIITDSAEDLMLKTHYEQEKISAIDLTKIESEKDKTEIKTQQSGNSEVREEIKNSLNKAKQKNSSEDNKEKLIHEQVRELNEQFKEKEKTEKNTGKTREEIELRAEKIREKFKDYNEENREEVLKEKATEQKAALYELFKYDKEKESTAKDELFKYDEQEKNEELERI